MMDSLRVEATEDTPLIDFNIKSGVLAIKGRSLPEDAVEFFKPVQKWLDRYIQNPVDNTRVEMYVDYYNSASTRYIFNILMTLEDLVDAGKRVRVIWHYKNDDDIIKAKGEELGSILELPFELKVI